MEFKEIEVKCVGCGKMMKAFKRTKRYCDDCNKQKRREAGKAYHKKRIIPQCDFDKLNHKLLEDSAAADARGLTYGQYMAEKRRFKL